MSVVFMAVLIQFGFNYSLYVFFDSEIVLLDVVMANGSNGWDRLIPLFFLPDGGMVIQDFRMKNFQINLLFGIIRNGSYKFTRRKRCDLRRRNSRIKLGGPTHRSIRHINRDALSFLNNLAKSLGK